MVVSVRVMSQETTSVIVEQLGLIILTEVRSLRSLVHKPVGCVQECIQ